jgi:thiamine biosynthesis protein ThiI
MEELKQMIGAEIGNYKFQSFRITAQRGDKSFHLTSEDINRELGAYVEEKIGARVDLKNPELTVFVEVLPKQIFFSFEKIKGVGGLPVGTAGKVVSLLSGGIDSPASSFMMMKRGCRVVFIHFHSFPYLDQSSQEKAVELAKILNQYQRGSRLYLVPFGDIQKQAVLTIPEAYRVIVYRRLMLRIAQKIAKKENAKALVTGESLGQVASQTLENISVIAKAVSLPVFRPLIGMDKEEIIKIAKKIETYNISIMPDQDCCQLFMPKHPATKSNIKNISRAESELDIEKLVSVAVENVEVKEF